MSQLQLVVVFSQLLPSLLALAVGSLAAALTGRGRAVWVVTALVLGSTLGATRLVGENLANLVNVALEVGAILVVVYAATRRAGHYTAAATINRLKSEGIPIFLTGDMNDRVEFFCRVAPITGMVSADGGSLAGGCHTGHSPAVDWVLGWGNVSFSGYIEDRSTLGDVSDHHFVVGTATVGPAS